MEKLKEEIDTVIDAKVSQLLEKEVKKMEVLMDSQRNLITNKVDSTLETKSRQIETMIDTKIAELKNVNIPIPSTKEQHRIILRIDALSEETQLLESIYQRKLDALDELKKSLLHQAFSGQL